MKVQDITACLETAAPPVYQESYDNAGLLTGAPDWEVAGVLATLDATEEVIAEAVERGCNLVVAHHPILFRGLKKLSGGGYVERALIRAIKQDVAIYAAHTNLDNVLQGVNALIAEKLGLQDRRILAPKDGPLRKLFTFAPVAAAEKVRQALFDAGAGHIGAYAEASFNASGTGTFMAGPGTHPYVGEEGRRHEEPEIKIEVILPAHLSGRVLRALMAAHPYEEVAYDLVALENADAGVGAGIVGTLDTPMEEAAFLSLVKDRMEAPLVRHTPLRGKPVERVAVCGGAGSFLTGEAIRAGADAFVSADFKYHEFFDADNQIIIADIGHYESEQFTPDIFCRLIRERFPNFAPLKSRIRTNPINYLH